MAKKVFLGVGHGGKDAGAVAFSKKEKDYNLAIALACRDELLRHKVTVKLSRTTDQDDPLNQEIKECNAFAPDLAVDIHNNAGGGDGAECFYHFGGGIGKVLAQNILTEIQKIGQNSRGCKQKKNKAGKDYYGFIRETVAPAVIVECAFMDNKEDISILSTTAKQIKMGNAIAHGILATLNIPILAQPKAQTQKPNPENPALYRVQIGSYKKKSNAEAMLKKCKAAGFNAVIVTADSSTKSH